MREYYFTRCALAVPPTLRRAPFEMSTVRDVTIALNGRLDDCQKMFLEPRIKIAVASRIQGQVLLHIRKTLHLNPMSSGSQATTSSHTYMFVVVEGETLHSFASFCHLHVTACVDEELLFLSTLVNAYEKPQSLKRNGSTTW